MLLAILLHDLLELSYRYLLRLRLCFHLIYGWVDSFDNFLGPIPIDRSNSVFSRRLLVDLLKDLAF